MLLARHLGAANWQIALLASVASLAVVVQPFCAGPLERIGYRRSFAGGWLATALLLGLAALLPFAPDGGGWAIAALLAIVLAIHVLRSFSQLAWFPWLGRILPPEQRGRFFGLDVLVAAAAGFAGLLLAGWALDERPGALAFAAVYGVVACFAVAAAGIAAMVPEGRSLHGGARPGVGVVEAARSLLARRAIRRVLVFVAAYNAFFSPVAFVVVLLQKDLLRLGAREILLLQAATQAGIVLTSALWGRVGDRFGTRPVLRLAAVGTLAIPCGWLLSVVADAGRATHVALALLHGVFLAAHGVGMMGLLMRTCSGSLASHATALFQGTAAVAAAATPPLVGALLSLDAPPVLAFALAVAAIGVFGAATHWTLASVPEPGRTPTGEALAALGARLTRLALRPPFGADEARPSDRRNP